MTTLAGRQLTENHRLAQVRLGALTAQQMFALWKLLDPADLDGTVNAWLRAAVPVVSAQQVASARLAAAYVTLFRQIETGERFPAVLADPVAVEQIITSLTVTGPVAVKTHMQITPVTSRAMDLGRTTSARSAMRLALNGGRDTLRNTVTNDPRATGYVRVTSGSPCTFCSDLAGRPMNSEEAYPAHDGCSCSGEPVFT